MELCLQFISKDTHYYIVLSLLTEDFLHGNIASIFFQPNVKNGVFIRSKRDWSSVRSSMCSMLANLEHGQQPGLVSWQNILKVLHFTIKHDAQT